MKSSRLAGRTPRTASNRTMVAILGPGARDGLPGQPHTREPGGADQLARAVIGLLAEPQVTRKRGFLNRFVGFLRPGNSDNEGRLPEDGFVLRASVNGSPTAIVGIKKDQVLVGGRDKDKGDLYVATFAKGSTTDDRYRATGGVAVHALLFESRFGKDEYAQEKEGWDRLAEGLGAIAVTLGDASATVEVLNMDPEYGFSGPRLGKKALEHYLFEVASPAAAGSVDQSV